MYINILPALSTYTYTHKDPPTSFRSKKTFPVSLEISRRLTLIFPNSARWMGICFVLVIVPSTRSSNTNNFALCAKEKDNANFSSGSLLVCVWMCGCVWVCEKWVRWDYTHTHTHTHTPGKRNLIMQNQGRAPIKISKVIITLLPLHIRHRLHRERGDHVDEPLLCVCVCVRM